MEHAGGFFQFRVDDIYSISNEFLSGKISSYGTVYGPEPMVYTDESGFNFRFSFYALVWVPRIFSDVAVCSFPLDHLAGGP